MSQKPIAAPVVNPGSWEFGSQPAVPPTPIWAFNARNGRFQAFFPNADGTVGNPFGELEDLGGAYGFTRLVDPSGPVAVDETHNIRVPGMVPVP